MEQCQQQIGNKSHPYLYLDGVGALAVEVSEWEVLLYLLEQRLYLPTATVYLYNSLYIHVKIVGQQRGKLKFVLLYVHIGDYTRNMGDIILAEDDYLFAILHQSLLVLIHHVHLVLIDEIFFHLGDVNHVTFAKFLEFGIVDIRSVKRYNLLPVEKLNRLKIWKMQCCLQKKLLPLI